MAIFHDVTEGAARCGLRFLVIGGHAVIEHGFQRGTEDADLLVCKDNRLDWIRVSESLGYRLCHDGGSFLQFESETPGKWNLDLMLVPSETFSRLIADARAANVEGVRVFVPALEHLLALKIHALAHGQGLRVLKDLTDVAQLLIANGVNPRAPWIRALFDKHGTTEMYERLLKLVP